MVGALPGNLTDNRSKGARIVTNSELRKDLEDQYTTLQAAGNEVMGEDFASWLAVVAAKAQTAQAIAMLDIAKDQDETPKVIARAADHLADCSNYPAK